MQASSRRLTDDELKDTSLEVDDPDSLPNLSRGRPAANLMPEIVGEYHLGPDRERLWCCHCQAHRHRNGFVVSDSSGKNYLIGSTCGPKHYGLSFRLARNQHLTLTRRKAVLTRLRSININSDIILSSIAILLHSDALRQIDRKREEIYAASEQVALAISIAIQNGSPLYENVKIRNFDAERRRDENSQAGKSGIPIYTEERRSLGMISGQGLFRRPDCRDRLLYLKKSLQDIRSIFRNTTDEYSLSSLTKFAKSAEEAWDSANRQIDESENTHLFFSSENLDRLERWSGTFERFSLQAQGDFLRVTDKKTTMIAPLPAFSLPRIPSLKPELIPMGS